MTKRTCTLDGCERQHEARGYCGRHYSYLSRFGDPLGKKCSACGTYLAEIFGTGLKGQRWCRDQCMPRCAASGCDEPRRKSDWCGAHYAHARRTGDAESPFRWRWAEPLGDCWVCGDPIERNGYRRSCSPRCQALLDRNGGAAPAPSRECAQCGTEMAMLRPGQRRRRSDALICAECKRMPHGVTPAVLASRDGSDCGICGTVVDLALSFPSPFRASIDHITPYSLGGTHDLENLQLSHLRCNCMKGNRIGFTLPGLPIAI